ncbi:MAG: hypothetical protein SXA11_25470 [Cyanobacteriota bacterium]|nr:hypothetical protein [Cyanobacteriota bacterium]
MVQLTGETPVLRFGEQARRLFYVGSINRRDACSTLVQLTGETPVLRFG